MTNSEERNKLLEELKKALDLSIQVANTRRRLDALSAQTFKAAPPAPAKQQILQPQYPAINPQVPFWTAELIPALIFWPYILIYYFGRYQTKLKEEADRIRNSPEYQQQCAAIDEAYRKREATAEAQYQAAMKQYNENVLPVYEEELAQWTKKHNEEVAVLKAELDKLEKELGAHYEATKVVPVQYRRINALQYIYDCMGSSNYTIAEAINSYEQAIQRQIEMERLEEERRRAEAEEARLEAEERAAWAAEEAAERAEQIATDSYSYSSSSSRSSDDGIFDRAKRRAEEDRERREKREAKRQADNAEYERKRQEARDSQRAWEAVHKANIERRRKGQPELPYPPRKYY